MYIEASDCISRSSSSLVYGFNFDGLMDLTSSVSSGSLPFGLLVAHAPLILKS